MFAFKEFDENEIININKNEIERTTKSKKTEKAKIYYLILIKIMYLILNSYFTQTVYQIKKIYLRKF